MKRLPLTSDELEILLAFETAHGLGELAQTLGRDPTVISKALKNIAVKAPVIEKAGGRWVITEMGKKMNSATMDLMLSADAILKEATSLRLGCNREFAPRVLVPAIHRLQKDLRVDKLTIKTFTEGTEHALLDGQIDIGIDCGTPYSAEIGFKLCADEPISIVCSPSFYKKHKLLFDGKHLKEIPMVLCDRLFPEKITLDDQMHQRGALYFNDIASARAACIHGLGWMFIPLYAAKSEIAAKHLMCPYTKTWGQEKYGVRWLRSRKFLVPAVHIIRDWLSSQKL